MRAKFINEFTRGGDPMQTMGIGTFGSIKKWVEETYDDISDDEWIPEILDNDELSNEQKKAWVEFLINKGYEWKTQEAWDLLIHYKIDIISNLPIGTKLEISGPNSLKPYLNDITFLKTEEGLFVEYTEWKDFLDFFDIYNKNTDFLRSLLSGDVNDYFYSDHSYQWPMNDVINLFTYNKSKLVILKNSIKEIFIKINSKTDDLIEIDTDDLDELFEEIYDNEDYETLKYAIQRSIDNTEDMAQQNAAYDHIIKTITNHYDLTNIEYKNDSIIANISKDGFHKLMYANILHERLVKYDYDGDNVYGDFDIDIFIDELENQLSDI